MYFLDELKQNSEACKVVKFPGTDIDVKLRLLSNGEMQAAVFATEKLFKVNDLVCNMGTVDAYEDDKTTQILYRALSTCDTEAKPLAATVDAFRNSISKDVKDMLAEEYSALESDHKPRIDELSEDEVNSLIEEVKKNPDSIMNVLSLPLLRKLTTTLASRLSILQKANGSS